MILITGCVPQSLRPDFITRSAEDAARDTIELDPGAPPPVKPQGLPSSPLRIARGGEAATENKLEGLKLTDDVGDLGNTWERLRVQFKLARPLNARVRRELKWFTANEDYLRRVSERARMYLPYILRETEARGMPVELALLPIIESAYQPFAYSPAGAAGIWQFIPSTAKVFGLKRNWWYDGRRDVVDATRAALNYLEKLGRDFGGDWLLAIASYNWGEGNVARAIRKNRAKGKATDFWSLRVPRETRAYVPRWLAVIEVVARTEHYKVDLPSIPDVEYFEPVHIGSQIDLALAAEMASIDMDEMYLLNAGFNRWATDPSGPHRLLLPVKAVDRFKQHLAGKQPADLLRWHEHEVTSGQSLAHIAKRYRINVASLGNINALTSAHIEPGQVLKVPRLSEAGAAVARSSDVYLARRAAVGTQDSRRHTYVVRRGDSLWRVARRNGVTVSKLARWNGISRNAIIRPGQRLVVWGKPKRKRATVTASVPPHYVVRRGDSLWAIAHRYQISTRSLARTNGLALSSVLQPGMRLKLPLKNSDVGQPETLATDTAAPARKPLTYTVKAGDSLWEISRRFKVSIASLRQWNQLPDDRSLQPGQKLRVYVTDTKRT